MKILITGSSGQIGSELCKMVESHDVLHVDKKIGLNLNDLKTQEHIRHFAPDVVFHLAASFERTTESTNFDRLNWEDNILATHNLLSCIDSAKTFIFASSYLVYDEKQYLNRGAVGLYEEMSLKPRNLCGASKLYLEKEIDFWAKKHRATACHARIFRVYSNKSQCFINHFFQMATMGSKPNVWNAESGFDLIHARDVAGALYSMMDHKAVGIMNVGTGRCRSVKEVIKLIGCDTIQAEDIPATERSYAVIGKIKNMTGWEPKIGLEDGIKEMHEEYSQEVA